MRYNQTNEWDDDNIHEEKEYDVTSDDIHDVEDAEVFDDDDTDESVDDISEDDDEDEDDYVPDDIDIELEAEFISSKEAHKPGIETDHDVINQMIHDAVTLTGEARTKAVDRIMYQMENYVKYVAHRCYRQFYNGPYWDDILNAGREGVFFNLEKYDPERGSPASFFFQKIRHEMSIIIRNDAYHTTMSRSTNMVKVKNAMDKHAAAGDATYTAVDIARETGLTTVAVKMAMNTISANNAVNIDADAAPQIAAAPDASIDPELAFIQKDGYERLRDAVKTLLTDEEALILCSAHGALGYKKMTKREIARTIGITTDRQNVIMRCAATKLTHNAALREYFMGHKQSVKADIGFEPLSITPDHAGMRMAAYVEAMDDLDEIEF